MIPAPAIATTVSVQTFSIDTGHLRLDEAAGSTVVQAPPTPEQIQASEAVFNPDPQADLAWGLLSVWTSGVLLHNLALDAFSSREEKKTAKVKVQTEE